MGYGVEQLPKNVVMVLRLHSFFLIIAKNIFSEGGESDLDF